MQLVSRQVVIKSSCDATLEMDFGYVILYNITRVQECMFSCLKHLDTNALASPVCTVAKGVMAAVAATKTSSEQHQLIYTHI